MQYEFMHGICERRIQISTSVYVQVVTLADLLNQPSQFRLRICNGRSPVCVRLIPVRVSSLISLKSFFQKLMFPFQVQKTLKYYRIRD
jgi:hypothetical protein